MTSTDRFKTIINEFISHQTATDDENKELEVRFGTRKTKSHGQKHTTKSDYDSVVKNLKAMDFTCDNVMGEYLMRIGYMFVNKAGRKDRSNVRVELNGHHVVKAYCEKESLQKIFDNSVLAKSVEFVKKEYMTKNDETDANGRPVRIFPYDSDDFGFRVALQTEKKMSISLPYIRSVVDDWDNTEKTFRYIKRFRFRHAEYPIFCDMSIVKSSRFGQTHHILEESGVFKNLETYEIELEVDNSRVDAFVERVGAPGLLDAIKKTIKVVLQGLQDTKFPVSYGEIDQVITDYGRTVLGNTGTNANITHKNFIGPSSITLQTKNLVEKKDSSIDLPNVRENYTVTDKADGDRNMCYITDSGKIYLIDSNMRAKFTGSTTNEKKLKNSLLDGELIMYNKDGHQINLFAAFDIYFVGGKDVRNNPFMSNTIAISSGDKTNNQRTIYRYTLLKQVMDLMKPSCVAPTSMNQMRFVIKLFEVTTAKKSIFECCKSVMDRINHESYTYETDGLIFTPSNDPLPLINYKRTWEKSFKWKPPKFNTIDFLISYSKTDKDEDVVRTRYTDGTGTASGMGMGMGAGGGDYKEIRLLCGFNQGHKDHGYMNPCQMVIDDKLPDHSVAGSGTGSTGRGNYEPMPFYPTNPYDANASICNIMIKQDINGVDRLFTTEGDVIENNTIVEFAYDNERETAWKWVPLRVRHDKTHQFKMGMNNFGNSYNVANSNWQSIHNPVTESMITTGRDIPDEQVDDDVYYNKVSGKTNTRALRDFHNMFIKRLLIMSATKPGGTLMDFAVGKAGDFPKWIAAKQSFVYGVDVSRDNIEHKLDGACARYLNYKKENSNTPYALFVEGDSGKHIKSGEASDDATHNRVNAAVFGTGPKDKAVLGPGVYRQYGIGKDGFDVTSCQFAFHYFLEKKDIFKTFLRNVSECTKVGGYFIGTCYDGETIFNLLADKDKGDGVAIFKNERKIWEIKKGYDEDTFPSDSSSIGYEVSVFQDSINQSIPEYLVNFSYVERIMSTYGFEVVGSEDAKKIGMPSGVGMFKELYSHMKSELNANKIQKRNIGSSLDMSDEEKKVSFLNKYFIFKKIRQVTQEDMHNEFESIEDGRVDRRKVIVTRLEKTIKLTRT